MKQLNIVVGLSRIREYEPAGPETEKCFNALLTMIAADGQPDSIVEKSGFIHFSEQLRPRYHLRARMTFREKRDSCSKRPEFRCQQKSTLPATSA